MTGAWYAKFVYGETGPRSCDDERRVVDGIRIEADGSIVALNGSYSCEVEHLEYFDPAAYGDQVLGVWSYEATCVLHYRPPALTSMKPQWMEFGDFRLFDRNGLELDVSASDRDASFFDDDQGTLSFMTYFRCP